MTTPRIEEMVEDLIKEFSTTELVLDTTDEYYIKGTSGDFADALKHALTQAHQAGIDEAVEESRVSLLFLAEKVLKEMNEIYAIDIKYADKKQWVDPTEFERMFLHRFNDVGVQALDETIKALQDNK